MRWLWLILLLPGSMLGADLDQLLAAHRANPSDWKIAHQAALAYTERGQFTEAAEFYRKALAGNPGFLPARKNLAVVLWFAGHRSEAEAIFRQLLPQLPRRPGSPPLPWSCGACPCAAQSSARPVCRRG